MDQLTREVRYSKWAEIVMAANNNIKIFEYFCHLLAELPKHENEPDTAYLDSLLPWSPDLPGNCRMPEKPDKENKKN